MARLVLIAPFLAIRYTGLIPVRPASYLRPLAQIIPDLPRRPPAVRDPEMNGGRPGPIDFEPSTCTRRSALWS